jgi:hypothetical protein
MTTLRWLCARFPAHRKGLVWGAYLVLIPGGAFWFICFPCSVFSLYFFDRYPSDYFLGIPQSPPFPKPAFLAASAAMTAFGLVMIFFNVRALRELRLKFLN